MSSSKEDAKNMALLFFMDHLMQKNGSRTIHDLSCQFGARGFTPEMREAVGTSQEGLFEFLSQYPSLFKLEGDSVSINAYGDLALGGSKASPLLQRNSVKERDSDAEAVEFFEQKLKKFGPELLVKSLLGHRSQAAPEVRLVSGRHVKDFCEFLQQHSNHFVVEGDRVRLAKMPEPTEKSSERDEFGQPLCGAKAKQAAVEYLKEVLEQQDGIPLPMENMYQKFCDRFSHVFRQEVATNPKELLQFLKLNRSLFFIRSNKVSLVKNKPEDSALVSESNGNCTSVVVSGDSNAQDKYLDHVIVVKGLKPAQKAIQDVVSGGLQQMEKPVVAIDFKIVNLGPQSQEFLALVCLGTADENLYIFDVAHSSSILLESGLRDLLESPNWIKVIHDCKRASSILFDQYGIHLQEVFDTQVCNAILQHVKTGKAVHEIRAVSFFHLQRIYYPEALMQSDVNPRKVHRLETGFWTQRPLTEEMVRFGVEEVRLLVPHVYERMDSGLSTEMRDLFNQMCIEQIDFHIQRKEVKEIRQERRQKHAMNVISDKLVLDPSGLSLSNRERKILNQVEQESKEEKGKNTVSSGKSECSCKCHQAENFQSNKTVGYNSELALSTREASTQTLSTGSITMTQIYYENK